VLKLLSWLHHAGTGAEPLSTTSLVANALMLSNVADMTTTLAAMDGDGHVVTPALVGCLSLTRASTSAASGNTSLTWATCRRPSMRNRYRSRPPREDFCTFRLP
jgi:hypothetical protein